MAAFSHNKAIRAALLVLALVAWFACERRLVMGACMDDSDDNNDGKAMG